MEDKGECEKLWKKRGGRNMIKMMVRMRVVMARVMMEIWCG